MKKHFSRRNFLRTAAVSVPAVMLPSYAVAADQQKKGNIITLNKNPLKLGLITNTIARDWDIETIIKNCAETKFQHVELRTTHKHGVEVTLSAAERATVKKRFEDAGLPISLASGFQYSYSDPAELKKSIEGTKEYVLLGRDIGALGIRVFTGSIYKNPEEKTLLQVAKALAEVGEFGHNNGVDIRVCNEGPISMLKKVIDLSQSPYVYVNWNCPMSDLEGKEFEYNFNSVKNIIKCIHIRALWNDYPWRLFFSLLSKSGYKGYCDAEDEIKSVDDPIRFLKYYRALFLAFQDAI